MSHKSRNPIVRAVTDALADRDLREMHAVDALMSVLPQRGRRAKPSRRRRATKKRR